MEDLTHAPLTHLVVIDFEATCDQGENPKVTRETQEIIEFPWVVIDLADGMVVDQKQIYVKPEWSTGLTDFCVSLTGITWEQLENAPSLAEAIEEFDAYVEEHFLSKGKGFCILTDGEWDLKVCLLQEAKKKGIELAPHFFQYYDLKNEFLRSRVWHTGHKPSLRQMIDALALTFTGRSHCGIDDCANIANVVLRLLGEGHVFEQPEEIPPDYDPSADPSYRDFNKSPSLFYRLPEGSQQETTVVVLRGLPWTTTEEQIEEFFGDQFEIVEGGVHLIANRSGRPSGVAYVEFKTPAQAVQALGKNESHLGERYIEVYLSEDSKMKTILENQGKIVPAVEEQIRPGDWTCPSCSDHQFATRVVCRKCRTPRPDYLLHPSARALTNPMHPAYAGFIHHGHQHPQSHGHPQVHHPGHQHQQHPHQQRAFMQHFPKQHHAQMHHPRQQGPQYHAHPHVHPHQHMHVQPPQQAFFVPPGQNGGAAPVEIRPGDWWCNRCSELNFASRRVCRKCGNASPSLAAEGVTFRPGGGRGGRGRGGHAGGRGGKQQHSENATNNNGQNGAPRGDKLKPNWYCPFCNDLNYGVRVVCRKCGRAPGQATTQVMPPQHPQGGHRGGRFMQPPAWQMN